jgi:hypothetical protein
MSRWEPDGGSAPGWATPATPSARSAVAESESRSWKGRCGVRKVMAASLTRVVGEKPISQLIESVSLSQAGNHFVT